MAVLLPKWQKFIDCSDGNNTVIGIHIVTILTALDTFEVPELSQAVTDYSSAGTVGSVAQLLMANGNTATTVEHSAADNTVTITGGTPGDDLCIVTCHNGNRMVNYETEL